MEEDKGVSRGEFEKLGEEITMMKQAICELNERTKQPISIGLYRCGSEGCSFVTDDFGAFVEHVVDERMRKHTSSATSEEEKPWEEVLKVEEARPKRHSTASELLDCPECAPKFESMLVAMGWEKPKPQKKSRLEI